MSIGWLDRFFVPDQKVADDAAMAWNWLIPGAWRIIYCTMFGGIFLEKESGEVCWLECSSGIVEHVAASEPEFHAFLSEERTDLWEYSVEDWFMPALIEQLRAAGKTLGAGQCYGLSIRSILEGGFYDVDNTLAVPASEWLTATGAIHEQIRHLPAGSRVKINVVDERG